MEPVGISALPTGRRAAPGHCANGHAMAWTDRGQERVSVRLGQRLFGGRSY